MKTTKPKKNNNNTPRDLPTMFGTSITRGYLQDNPATEAMIDYICEKLIEYACSDDALFIGCFLRSMRIPKQTFHNWLAKYPKLAEAYAEAKDHIAYGRMYGAAKRTFDRGVIMHSQYRFGDEWKQDDIHQSDMRKRDDGRVYGDIRVIMPVNEEVIDRSKFKPIKSDNEGID